jgi:hypothetical protein
LDPFEFVSRPYGLGSRKVLPGAPAAGFLALALGLIASLVFAETGRAEPPSLSVELNKLEPQGGGCRAYFVIANEGPTQYQVLKLDLVLFQRDGVIGHRVAVDLAPLKASKRSVKRFDLDGIACDQIGSFLINEVMECRSDTGPIDDCLSGMSVKSLSNVQLTK